MSPGPLRRLAGALGLAALLPTAALLTVGSITLADAAVRAAVTLVGVTAIGRGAGWWLASMAAQLERREPATSSDEARGAEQATGSQP